MVLDIVNIWREKLEVAAADYKYIFLNHAMHIQEGMTHAVFGAVHGRVPRHGWALGGLCVKFSPPTILSYTFTPISTGKARV